MSTTSRLPIGRLHAVVDEIAGVDPIYLSVEERQEALVEVSRAEARLQAVKLALLAASDDIAEATGARSTAAWLADETRDAHATLRRNAVLADKLDSRWAQVQSAFAAGRVNLAQVRVIAESLDALPADLGQDRLAKAEILILDEADKLGLRELRVYGSRLLEFLAPEVADEHEYQQLLDAERRADAATRLTLRPRGDGSTDIHGRIPDQVAGRLRAYLNAFTAPRRRHLQTTEPDEFADLPIERQRGIAFGALLENIPTTSLPRHGGTATSLMVTIDHDTLVADLDQAGIATTSTGQQVTAGQARRLGCQADLLPAVLGSKSEILDLGRKSRLYQDPQRKAMKLRDKTCTARGCTMPAEFCEAHHKKRWSKGGKTNLDDGTLLCPFHHQRAHDPDWETTYHPNGSTTFTRRRQAWATRPPIGISHPQAPRVGDPRRGAFLRPVRNRDADGRSH